MALFNCRRHVREVFLFLSVGLLVACGGGGGAGSSGGSDVWVSTFAGVGPGNVDAIGGLARFNRPMGQAVDVDGNIYVADAANATIRKISATGVVTTFAGSPGKQGASDGAGAVARFNWPQDVAIDGDGYLYVADTGNNLIRKISPGGVVSTLAGRAGVAGAADGAGTVATFSGPAGVDVGADGTIYVADQSNSAIRKVTVTGSVTTLGGGTGEGDNDGPGATAKFRFPSDVVVDALGNVYVADYGNHTIRRIGPDGQVTTLAGSAGNYGRDDGVGSAARFASPAALDIDGGGNIYVVDQLSGLVRTVTAAGEVTTLAGVAYAYGSVDGAAGEATFNRPAGISLAATGELYVSDSDNNTIRKVGIGGGVTTLAGLASPGFDDGPNGRFYNPSAVGVAPDGSLVVADVGTNVIRRVSVSGAVTTIAGLAGVRDHIDGPSADARFDNPEGVVVSPDGTIYVADTGSSCIRRIATDGVVSTIAGEAYVPGAVNGLGTAARFSGPTGLAMDAYGNLYVADSGNHLVRKITPAGYVSTLAGSGAVGSQNGAALSASFMNPVGVAVHSDGVVYVSDADAHVIRKISTAGVVSTFAGRSGVDGFENGASGSATFWAPWGLAIDGVGNLFVADVGNSAIRKITPSGTVSTFAGGMGFGNQDGLGSVATFWTPVGVAANGLGAVFVVDQLTNTIRKIVVQ